MPSLHPRALVHGLVGGLIAGGVVATWFLAVDLIAGQPFATPAALASVMLGDESTDGSFRLVAAYTVVHFGIFALLGMATSWFLAAIGVPPGLLVGAVFGLGVLDSVYYGALLVTGADMLTVLPARHVLAANLMGGMLMMAYLHHAMRAETPLGLAVLRDHTLAADGIAAGLLGAGAVALWFLVVDAWAGTPFFTPAALGSLVFLGATSPLEVQVTPGIVAAYTVLHVAAFSAVGTALVWSAERLERTPGIWLLGIIGFIVLEGLFIGTAVSLGEWVLGAVSWWAVGVGNAIAVTAMGVWIWRTRPLLRRQLMESPVNTMV